MNAYERQQKPLMNQRSVEVGILSFLLNPVIFLEVFYANLGHPIKCSNMQHLCYFRSRLWWSAKEEFHLRGRVATVAR